MESKLMERILLLCELRVCVEKRGNEMEKMLLEIFWSFRFIGIFFEVLLGYGVVGLNLEEIENEINFVIICYRWFF